MEIFMHTGSAHKILLKCTKYQHWVQRHSESIKSETEFESLVPMMWDHSNNSLKKPGFNSRIVDLLVIKGLVIPLLPYCSH